MRARTRTNCIVSRMLYFYYFIDVQRMDDMSALALDLLGSEYTYIDHIQISNQVIIREPKPPP